ncbi:HNH endonuclease signature motif containing protein [Streptomyces europaeiscabiei]|uniref:HNH endonuclease signature motif containing protein n=1 Tax=Streptomyces europaeiscabiei TaxID=146819 RepID=UPI0029A794F6|nr:HNH endonuclease signature motif containing protein [Streptomyces europaeiscabiei]MDX3666962.1 HNH endonuclease signature motif containing protein [Streptomyces europaeiscabiei]
MPTFTLPMPRITDEDWARFLEKVDPPNLDGCQLWNASAPKGYGQFFINKRPYLAHRVAYTRLVGPIPPGLELDHSYAKGCRSKLCVNTDHLEPITHAENVRRGHAARRWRASIEVVTELDEG